MPFTTGSKQHVQVSSRPATSLVPRSTRSASYAPSISSVMSSTSTLVPEAHQQRGFKSREAYLAALQQFADRHEYMQAGDQTLTGFYGEKTMDFYKTKTSPLEDRRRRREREAREKECRQTLPSIVEDSTSLNVNGDALIESGQSSRHFSESGVSTSEGEATQKDSRRSRFGKVFGGRRRTVA